MAGWHEVLVDTNDYDELNQFKWCYRNGYASRWSRGLKPRVVIYMHNQIMNHIVNPDTQVDHINKNKIDNRKKNLRILTTHLNISRNKMKIGCKLPPPKNTKIDPFGNYMPKYVTFNGISWVVMIKGNYVGSFNTFDSACKQAKLMEKLLFH